MKLTLAILALVVFALSLWADHKWRQWIKISRSSDPDSTRSAHNQHR